MLTAATTPVDAPRTVMWTVTQIADRDGISKQAVSNHVKRLVERSGLAVERDGIGRVAKVNVAEYDHLRGVTGDPSKAQAPRSGPASSQGPVSPHETYDEALRQKTWHEAEKRRLELDELKGKLIRRDRLASARIGLRGGDRQDPRANPFWSDDLATAVAREGTHGLNVAIKARTGTLRNEIAAALDTLATASPAADGDHE